MSFRDDFPVLEQKTGSGVPITYLDSAATTLKPIPVAEAVATHYREGASNVHRGLHFLSEQATAAFESTRAGVATFLNADSSKEIILTSGTTESINIVARSYGDEFLSEGDEILISHMEHHSNIVPWQMLCERKGCVLKVIPITDSGELDLEAFRSLLSNKTKILSLVYVSNSLGTINPVRDLIRAAKSVGAVTLIDGAQAVAHMPIDVQDLGCDFFAFSGHKLFGPTGVGVLYGREALLESMPPFLGGGDMIRSVSFEGTTYAGLPAKFEAGTPHIGGVIGLGAALEYVKNVGFSYIHEQELDLLNYATETLAARDGLQIVGTAREKASVVSFTLENIHPHDIGTLMDEHGVAIRAGHHCCQPVMTRFNVPATARLSMAFYNNRQDIDRAAEAVDKVQELFR